MRMPKPMPQRAIVRCSSDSASAAQKPDAIGSATSPVASGLMIANGSRPTVCSGGPVKPTAASFAGSLCQT